MENKKVIILGAGYAGLNAFYEISRKYNTILISDTDNFVFYTGFLRNLIFNGKHKYITKIRPTIVDRVKEIDIERKTVKTSNGKEIDGDILILALGCDRKNQLNFIRKVVSKNKVSLGVEDKFDEYLAIQLAFYLRRINKQVAYYGSTLKWLGENVSHNLIKVMEKYGMRIAENAEDIIPSCKPNEVIGEFLPVNDSLEYKPNIFVIGDLIKSFPKLGELAMREGFFLGKNLSKKSSNVFKPIYINIIDTGWGEAIHIRSNLPWGGNLVNVKISKLRAIMKRVIEKYYIIRKGKMGFFYYL